MLPEGLRMPLVISRVTYRVATHLAEGLVLAHSEGISNGYQETVQGVACFT